MKNKLTNIFTEKVIIIYILNDICILNFLIITLTFDFLLKSVLSRNPIV